MTRSTIRCPQCWTQPGPARWRCWNGPVPTDAACLVAAPIAFNLTRAIGVTAGGKSTQSRGREVRARILNAPARVSRSGPTGPAPPATMARGRTHTWTMRLGILATLGPGVPGSLVG